MLKNGRVASRLPAQNLERARAFYARGAWFRDSEGNLLGIGQPVRG
jgi:hypothetical protein